MILRDKMKKARLAAGLSQEALAQLVGLSQTTVNKIEAGAIRKSRAVARISHVLKIPLDELDPDFKLEDELPLAARTGQSNGMPSSAPDPETVIPIYPLTARSEANVLGRRLQPTAYIARPDPLIHASDAYGLVMAGQSMRPIFRPRDILLVHPNLWPEELHDDVVVFSKDQAKAILGEYVQQDAGNWILRQYSPHTVDIRLNQAEWPTLHVIVGKFSRR